MIQKNLHRSYTQRMLCPLFRTHTSAVRGVFCSVLSEGGAWSMHVFFLLTHANRAWLSTDSQRRTRWMHDAFEFLPLLFASHLHSSDICLKSVVPKHTHPHTHTTHTLDYLKFILKKQKTYRYLWFNFHHRFHQSTAPQS